MKDTLIEFNTAVLLKNKDFDIYVNNTFTLFLKTNKSDNPSFATKKGEITENSDYFKNNGPGDFSNKNYTCYARPTQSLLQAWLREVHHILIFIEPLLVTCTGSGIRFSFVITDYTVMIKEDDSLLGYLTYEEALEVALIEGLKLIK